MPEPEEPIGLSNARRFHLCQQDGTRLALLGPIAAGVSPILQQMKVAHIGHPGGDGAEAAACAGRWGRSRRSSQRIPPTAFAHLTDMSQT